MIDAETTGSVDLSPLKDYLLPALAGKVTASVSGKTAAYLKNTRFGELFESGTGRKNKGHDFQTKDTIDIYRFKSKKPAYIVKAGVGISGLNYLEGFYKGSAKSRSGKTFQYKQPRPLLHDAKEYAESSAAAAWERMTAEVIDEAEKMIK
jgi:hypothetical protein